MNGVAAMASLDGMVNLVEATGHDLFRDNPVDGMHLLGRNTIRRVLDFWQRKDTECFLRRKYRDLLDTRLKLHTHVPSSFGRKTKVFGGGLKAIEELHLVC